MCATAPSHSVIIIHHYAMILTVLFAFGIDFNQVRNADRADGTDHWAHDLAEQHLNSFFSFILAIQAVYLPRNSPTEFIP
jgi:hypothetical protein